MRMLESSPDKFADRAEKRLNANEEMFMAEEFWQVFLIILCDLQCEYAVCTVRQSREGVPCKNVRCEFECLSCYLALSKENSL